MNKINFRQKQVNICFHIVVCTVNIEVERAKLSEVGGTCQEATGLSGDFSKGRSKTSSPNGEQVPVAWTCLLSQKASLNVCLSQETDSIKDGLHLTIPYQLIIENLVCLLIR